MSNRVLFIGGFGHGVSSVERVASALEEHYDVVEDPMIFSWAMDNLDTVRKVARGAVVKTLSGGMMAAVGTQPESLHAFGAPLPSGRAKLLARTVSKTARMHTPGVGIRSADDLSRAIAYDIDTTVELATHPLANLKHLGAIARFNAVHVAAEAVRSGVRTELAYTDKDSYFRPTDADHALAEISNVPITMLSGQHDELVLRPEATLATYLARS